jgi:acyl carrier protein
LQTVEKKMSAFVDQLKQKVVETLNLVDIDAEDIDANDQLIGGKLGIDSIDILELVMMIEKDYSVKIDSKELGAKVFASLNTLAEHIRQNCPEMIH